MGCRCNDRRAAIVHGASSAARGRIAPALAAAGFVTRTLAQDLRSATARREMLQRVTLARLRGARR